MEEAPDEEEAMSEGNEMSENTKTFLTQLSENLLPVFDRHFDIKEKKLQIEEGKVIADLARSGIHLTPQNGETGGEEIPEHPGHEEEEEPETEEVEAEEMDEGQYNNYIASKMISLSQSDPKRYREVIAAVNAGGDVEDLLAGGTGFDVDPEDPGAVEEEAKDE